MYVCMYMYIYIFLKGKYRVFNIIFTEMDFTDVHVILILRV